MRISALDIRQQQFTVRMFRGLDISPMIVILVLWFAQSVLLGWLREMAYGLR